ncbi:hypothetical protein PF008_g19008 [Phytophthora fragariae]|uniref:Uncharacterized protein n=1 Tax=Phytophthora fragariae TaxID=53985 RepID=A0A6G0R3X2_9STRA|nr:hypothetical protein PF008_g19008 [Phytophthora fragariae]
MSRRPALLAVSLGATVPHVTPHRPSSLSCAATRTCRPRLTRSLIATIYDQ